MELWGMWYTLSLLLHLRSLRPGVVVPVKVPPTGQIELFDHLTAYKQITDIKLNC